jgi:hypothetical protein
MDTHVNNLTRNQAIVLNALIQSSLDCSGGEFGFYNEAYHCQSELNIHEFMGHIAHLSQFIACSMRAGVDTQFELCGFVWEHRAEITQKATETTETTEPTETETTEPPETTEPTEPTEPTETTEAPTVTFERERDGNRAIWNVEINGVHQNHVWIESDTRWFYSRWNLVGYIVHIEGEKTEFDIDDYDNARSALKTAKQMIVDYATTTTATTETETTETTETETTEAQAPHVMLDGMPIRIPPTENADYAVLVGNEIRSYISADAVDAYRLIGDPVRCLPVHYQCRHCKSEDARFMILGNNRVSNYAYCTRCVD